MLVAYGPDGRPVVAEEAAQKQLQEWSQNRTLYCPNCRGNVHIRGGAEKRIQLHFAHQKGECAWSTESESVRHAQGKVVLASWLRQQFPQATVTLEERLPEPNRIADVFLVHKDGQQWAIEFQCAPLELDEWQHRHTAYRKANILDIWIIGVNRREKQEALIEAVIGTAHEILFLDPLVTPARVWLRWPVSGETMKNWQQGTRWTPSMAGWVGRFGYGATLTGQLQDITLTTKGNFQHSIRTALENRTQLLQAMKSVTAIDETFLVAYLRPAMNEESLQQVIIPLMRAYLRDPDLLRRWNYGRGQLNQPVSQADGERVKKACSWLAGLEQKGYALQKIQEMMQEIPYIGPYAAFTSYVELLISLLSSNE